MPRPAALLLLLLLLYNLALTAAYDNIIALMGPLLGSPFYLSQFGSFWEPRRLVSRQFESRIRILTSCKALQPMVKHFMEPLIGFGADGI